MRRLLYTLFFASLLTACGGNDDNLPEPEPLPVVEGDRAVLVYMADDNSLDNSTVDFAGEDMKEMVEGLGTFNTEKNVHLLVYVDKKRKIADAPDASFPCLMELTNEDGVGKYTVLKEYESPRNSVGLDEMKEVFKDVFSAYQASSYGLVYWSHGDGWVPQRLPDTRWIGQDGNNYMDLSEFAEALQVVPYLDFLMFDACFMQSVEVAYALRNEADYIIASPTEIPGPGAPYKEIMQWIMTEGAAKQIGEVYYDMYRAKYNGGVGMSNDNWTGGVSIAVTRTEDLEALAQATREALSTITPPLNQAFCVMPRSIMTGEVVAWGITTCIA